MLRLVWGQFWRWRRAAALGVLAGFWLCPAWATAAAKSSELLELPLESLMGLTVSVASPFRENVMAAASSVAVLRPEDWQRRGARSLEEALDQVPAVVSYGSLGGARMTAIRGYATELSSRGIATLLDGVPLNNFSYATANYDTPFYPLSLFNRVEMIRGPGSTLYGSDAFHGVVALTSWDPSASANSAQLSAGSQDDGVAALHINARRDSDWRVNAGIAATHHGDRDLSYTYTNPDPDSNNTATGVRDNHEHDVAGFLHLGIGAPALSNGLWRLSFYGDRYRARGFPGLGTQFYQPLQQLFHLASLSLAQDRETSGQESGFWLVQLLHQRPLRAGLELELRSFQWQSDQTWEFDLTRHPDVLVLKGLNIPLRCRQSPDPPSFPPASPLFCGHIVHQGAADRRQGVHALLKRDEDDGATQWALGAGRDWLKVLESKGNRIAPDGTVYLDIVGIPKNAARHIDHLLFQGRTALPGGRWSVVYGVRWDDYTDVGSATSPRLGLIYQPQAAWAMKALYSHAFRAPSAVEQKGTAAGGQQLPNPNIRPETIDSVELVGQHQTEGQETELVVFQSRWQDGIVLAPLGPGINQYQNTGSNRAHGVELAHRQELGPWRLEANAAYVRSKNEQSQLAYGAFPRYTLNLGVGRRLTWQWELWVNERALLDLTQTDALGNQAALPASDFYRTDLHLSRQFSAGRLWGDVRNLTDRHNTVPALYNAEGGLPDERRSWRLGAELTF